MAAANVGTVTQRRVAWASAIAAVTAAGALLLPWAGSGARTRSTIELLAATSALDVLSAPHRWLLVTAWFGVVVVAAAGLWSVAHERLRWGAACFAVLGPALVATSIVIRRSPFSLEWGAYVASGFGLAASIGGGAVLAGVGSRQDTAR